MRHTLPACLAATLLLWLSSPGLAQDPDPEDLRPRKARRPQIEKIRYGFVGGGVTRSAAAYGDFKAGAWTPVYVDVLRGSEDLLNARIVIEGTDCDDVKYTYTVPIPPLTKETPSQQVIGYTKPSAFDTEIEVTLWVGDRQIAERKESPSALDPGNVLFLALGARLQGVVRALAPPGRPFQNVDDPLIDGSQTQGRFIGYLDDWKQLPSRWFGYEGADQVFLLTGDRNFIQELLNDHEVNKDASRYAALAEWVRRGGRLIVFAGRNHDVLAALDARQPLLPVRPVRAQPKPDDAFARRWSPELFPPAGMHVTQFEPKAGQEFQVEGDGGLAQALMVKGRHGLGRVTVFAFDVEQPPFTRWKGQDGFWSWFLKEQAPQALVTSRHGNFANPGMVTFGGGEEGALELGSQLQGALEDFQDVPVISFGWVALFILLYILIVGPLDYFFLKKVVKRLELTWVTFPVVVVVISAGAYFTAYYVKGNDQRINKVDLVDIDLHGAQAQVYGQTWFTIFSPRIQHYTIGVEPAADAGWAPRDKTATALSWLGRPDTSSGGFRRQRSQGLFRRTYEFEPDLSAMRGVHIPVWSTKSFTASWATSEPAAAPFVADIRRSATDAQQLAGTIRSRLPVPLDDAVLVRRVGTIGGTGEYRVYHLDTLVPGAERELATLFREPRPISYLNEWASRLPQTAPLPTKAGISRAPQSTTASLVTQFLFHGALRQGTRDHRQNSSMRHLDQSWRLGMGEIILFGRVNRLEQEAETVTADARSPSRLWLGQVPAPGASRPTVNGSLSQETYVRVFIPIRTADQ